MRLALGLSENARQATVRTMTRSACPLAARLAPCGPVIDAKAAERAHEAIAKRAAAFPRVLATSSEKGLGMPELRAEIVRLCIEE